MKAEAIKVFEKVLTRIKNDTTSEYICVDVRDICERGTPLEMYTSDLIHKNKPTKKQRFPEIYNHKTFKGTYSWWDWKGDEEYQTTIKPQKIKYLELLIKKLKDEEASNNPTNTI